MHYWSARARSSLKGLILLLIPYYLLKSSASIVLCIHLLRTSSLQVCAEHFTDSSQDNSLTSLDLTCLKTIITRGEANVVSTGVALVETLRAYGAPTKCLIPAFGMTETCAGSIYSTLFPKHDLEREYDFASVGRCVNGMELRIVDEHGVEMAQGVSGSLEVRGPVVFSQYYNNAEATTGSFHDGWFITGDTGQIDSAGQLILTGRTKDTIIINGVNYAPNEIETAVDIIPGVVPSYTCAFAYRRRDSDTESVCAVYLPAYDPEDMTARVTTCDVITSTVMLHVGVKRLVIPLGAKALQKSTLGKLSRNKIAKAFQRGEYDSYMKTNQEQTTEYQRIHYEEATNEMERSILETFVDAIGVEELEVGVNANLYAFDVNSIDVIKIKQRLERKFGREIPTIVIIRNPTARTLAAALDDTQRPEVYNPMVVLQEKGTKTPLWLVHPGVGEILVFFGLASQLTDRPVYAMRAKGFEKGEKYFYQY